MVSQVWSDLGQATHTIWAECKGLITDLLPYAVIVWLIWTMQVQHQRLIEQHITALQGKSDAQFIVLSAIRDTLSQRGLVVPPLEGTN